MIKHVNTVFDKVNIGGKEEKWKEGKKRRNGMRGGPGQRRLHG